MRKITILTVAVVALGISGGLFAQSIALAPTYGTITLTTGFTPDPHQLTLTAGGSIDASGAGLTTDDSSYCNGMIADAPDYRLHYTGGTTYPLIIRVTSTADTTLVVNTPSGTWRCNDDTNGLNPQVMWPAGTAPSGQYDIWVGTWGTGSAVQPATLSITELL
jgi:hypothetical protein